MKKILLLCMSFLSVFCFSSSELKDLKWGLTREEVIKKIGKPSFSYRELMQYENIKYENVNLEKLSLEFENNKLTSWSGKGTETKIELDKLVDTLSKKYDGFKLAFENRNDDITRTIGRYNLTGYLYEGKGNITLDYWDKSKNVTEYKTFDLHFDSLTLIGRRDKVLGK